jgi:phage baseplate assembly protein V
MMRALESLVQKMRAASGIGELTLTDDSKTTQRAQFKSKGGQVFEDARRYETYGISIRPLRGAGVLWSLVGFVTRHVAVLSYPDPRYRKKGLQEGEVSLYTDEGDYIILSRGRIVKVVAGAELDVTAPVVKITASTSITLDSPNVKVTGNLKVDGTSDLKGFVTAEAGGDVIGTLGTDTLAANTSLQIAGKEMGGHKHHVAAAPGDTGAPL